MQRLLLIAVVAGVTVSSGAAQAQAPGAPGQGAAAGPACATFDAHGQSRTSFEPGEDAVVRGTSFPPSTTVLLTFQQAPQTAELGRYQTDASGGWATDLSGLKIPPWASEGMALVRVSSVTGTASCELQVLAPLAEAARSQPIAEAPAAPAAPAAQDPSLEFVVWGMLLALLGGVMTFLSYRRWQLRRLEGAMARLNGHKPSAPAAEPAPYKGYAHPPLLKDIPAPAQAPSAVESGFSYAEPPVLPMGWDSGREPTPVRYRAAPEPAPEETR